MIFFGGLERLSFEHLLSWLSQLMVSFDEDGQDETN